jgi:hypothetical protein
MSTPKDLDAIIAYRLIEMARELLNDPNTPSNERTRSTLDWIKNGPSEYPTSGAFIDAIKLNAMKVGARRAAEELDGEVKLEGGPFASRKRTVQEAKQAILAAAELWDVKDL